MDFVLDTNSFHPARLDDVKAAKSVALINKATEGTVYRDPTYPEGRKVAKEAGVPFGGYVYIHWNDPGDQHKYFLNYARPQKGDLQPIVDAEDPKASVEELTKRAWACLRAFSLEGYNPILYASSSVWLKMIAIEPRIKAFRVWEAQYPGRFTRWFPKLATLRIRLMHGVSVVLWQWTPDFAVNGRHYDCSVLMTSLDNLRIGGAL